MTHTRLLPLMMGTLAALCCAVAGGQPTVASDEYRSQGKDTQKLQKAVAAVRGGDCAKLDRITDLSGQYVDASYALAMLFAEGICVEQDVERAIDLSDWNCQRRGDVDSCDFLVRQLIRGTPSADQLTGALALARFGAYQGHAPSMLSLGWLYARASGPSYDLDAAVYWYHRAAAAGLHRPMYNLFFIYLSPGPRWSPDKAREWLQRAADAGSASAYIGLARHYERGSVLFERDGKKAYFWKERFRETGVDSRGIRTPGLPD